MSLESYLHKPQPKQPKGFMFQITIEETEPDFNDQEFMNQFATKPTKKEKKKEENDAEKDEDNDEEKDEDNDAEKDEDNDAEKDEDNDEEEYGPFVVKKLEMITIAVKELKVIVIESSCDIIPPPESDTPYFMNNRLIFMNQLKTIFAKYKNKKDTVTCDSMKEGFKLLTHQKVIKDYINIETP